MKRPFLTITWLLATVLPTFAQITLDFPFSRMVFQRDLNSEGKILVTGQTIPKVDSVTVQLVPVAIGTGLPQNEERCDDFRHEKKQLFSLILDAPSGWYNLIVRTYRNSRLIDIHQLDKVGIGDVFLIAGQSNAQGHGFRNPPSSVDIHERVGTILDYSLVMNQLSTFNYQKLLAHFYLYPSGNTSWCYGLLGDMLVQRNNVPILFLNAAIGGTSSTDWAQSIDNKATHTEGRPNFPYHLLSKTLQFYANITGFRAILWHQGEFDTIYPPAEGYFHNVRKVINETRKQVNFSLPWVVSEVSYFLDRTSPAVIADQRRLVKDVEQVYKGPATDGFIHARSDGIHFSNEPGYNGLTLLANAWNEALSPDFFKNAKPLLPNFTFPTILYDNKNTQTPAQFEVAPFHQSFDSFQFIKSQNGNHFVSPKVKCETSITLNNDSLVPREKLTRIFAQKDIEISLPIKKDRFAAHAESYIVLNPGFSTQPNATFIASLKGCYESTD